MRADVGHRHHDLNGNLSKELVWDRPEDNTTAREIEYVYADGTGALEDRVQYIRHKRTSDGTWKNITSSSTNPTYFAFGGFKTIVYANGITETNTKGTCSLRDPSPM